MVAEKMPGVPLSEIAQAVTPPARQVVFTPEEARRGRKLVGNTLVYCCYGMYCDAGHSSYCKHASGVLGTLPDQKGGA